MFLVDNHQSGDLDEEGSTMELIWFLRQWKRILFPTVCLLLSGCGSFFPEYSAPPSTSSGSIIYGGTTASFICGDMEFSLASGSYELREFIDEFGEKRNETLSGLSAGMAGKPEAQRYYRAYAGMRIYYYSATIQVIRIGNDRNNIFTEVQATYLNKAGEIETCHAQ
jgi:hypothetical protein